MKKKLVITLLLTALTTTSLAGCGKKETATDVTAENTEAVAEINTEAETETEELVVAETEEDTESESDTEVVAKNDDKNSDKTETKANGKTESSKNESNNSNKNNGSTSTNNNTQTEQPSAPVETPVETPAVETPVETPVPELAPAENLCPYGPFDQWLDLGNGWWGYYTCFQSPEGTISALNDEFTNVIVSPDATWTYDDWGTEFLGTYDDAKDVVLTKFHMVPITN